MLILVLSRHYMYYYVRVVYRYVLTGPDHGRRILNNGIRESK